MYLRYRFYYLLSAVILIIAMGYAVPPLFTIGRILFWLLVALVVVDMVLLWSRRGIRAFRTLSLRFSNGDDNPVSIRLESNYPFAIRTEVIDEVPPVFQRRDILFLADVRKMGEATITYQLRPTERGIYSFGRVRVFVSTLLGLVQRRYTCCEPQDVKVYPSYMMLRQYELLAMSNNLTEMGIKRIRRIGNNTDFEQIKDYIVGDDYRTINWRATARRHQLMVNVYQDERSQQVFSVIDKGRMMQQAFQEMTLLDYAINAALVLSYVTINKQQTQFGETDYSALLAGLSRHVTRRSLLILYTSFTSMASMRRQLQYLRQLNMRHRLLVVFFEDEELRDYIEYKPQTSKLRSQTTESVYQHVVAEKFAYEQRLIVQTLRQYGIQSLLTTPRNLSVDVINKYLEIKSKM